MCLEKSLVREGLQTYRDIPHNVRLPHGNNLSIVALLQLRREAARAVYEEGILEPYRVFKYQSSNSTSSAELED